MTTKESSISSMEDVRKPKEKRLIFSDWRRMNQKEMQELLDEFELVFIYCSDGPPMKLTRAVLS